MNIVEKISKRKKIYKRLKGKPITWHLLSEYVHSFLGLDEQKTKSIQTGFGRLWTRYSQDLLNKDNLAEYNSIKHGQRVLAGGFTISIGEEETRGVPVPPENMKNIGGSRFGSTFFIKENIGKHNYSIKNQSKNWNPKNLISGLNLLSMSINNIVGFLKIFNGIKPEECVFTYPKEDVFNDPWSVQIPVSDFKIGVNFDFNSDDLISKDDILNSYIDEE